MAEKLPTKVTTHNLGDLKLTIASFDGTVSSNDIDDNDTWPSGIKSYLGSWWMGSSDNGYDVSITSVSDGTITFDSAGSTTGTLFVISKDY